MPTTTAAAARHSTASTTSPPDATRPDAAHLRCGPTLEAAHTQCGIVSCVPLRLGRQTWDDTALLVMAIVNRTPDSFYDKGATYADDAALDAVARAVDDGADLVDIGGVKAGPGASVDATEETRRVAPFVAAVRARHP